MINEKFNMWLHVSSWNPTCVQSFRFVLFAVFEIQGFKLNNNNKKQKNWENELFVLSPLLVMQFLSCFRFRMYVAHSYHSAATELNSH